MKDETRNFILILLAFFFIGVNFGTDFRQTKAINAQTAAIDKHTKALEALAAANNQLMDEVFPNAGKTNVVIK